MSKIQIALENIFKEQRVVFWYDKKQELHDKFDVLMIPGVEKIEIQNNEFGIKYRITTQEPDQKFLLYFNKPRPDDLDNWLLDLLLANYEFQTDQAAIFLQELGLPYEFKPVITEHIEFFKSKKRLEELKNIINQDDQPRQIRRKIMAVICKTEPDLEQILLSLLDELSMSSNIIYDQLSKFGFAPYLWDDIERLFGYASNQANPKDFVIELFKANYQSFITNEKPKLNKEAVVFINRWKDSLKYSPAFDIFSNQMEEILNIKKNLEERTYETLKEMDLFKIIDKKLIVELKNGLLSKSITPEQVVKLVSDREHTHWYSQFSAIYQAIRYAAQFLDLMPRLTLKIENLKQGVNQYKESYYKLDQFYRKFIFHYNQASQNALLEDLAVQVEKNYSNQFLLPLNDNWQQCVDASPTWDIEGVEYQRHFFKRHVQPYIKDGIKVFVVISDALRYESGEELLNRLLKEDRFTADLSFMVSSIPSYTQLGMASLLPNQSVGYNEKGAVFVDGVSTKGTANRDTILGNALKGKGKAIKAEEFLSLNTKTEGRALSKKNDVVYIYHNGIDAIGDKRETEGKVFDAVETEFETIIKILKQISNINVSNVIITADHGFLYQNTKLDESDYSDIDCQGEILQSDRRFVIGKNLMDQSCAKKYKVEQLGFKGDFEFLIAKSINRFRVKGAGSRYVHGGASLQEVVLPVITFSKKRVSDISFVDVDLIKTTSLITSGQATFSFYQETPVEDKVLPRVLKIGFYSKSNILISDVQTVSFDSVDKDARNREKKIQFNFSKKSEDFNGQDIVLRMEIPLEGTSHFQTYKEFPFTFKRSFTSDFDEF